MARRFDVPLAFAALRFLLCCGAPPAAAANLTADSSPEEVCAFLMRVRLEAHCAAFVARGVGGRVARTLKEEHLKELGMSSPLDRHVFAVQVSAAGADGCEAPGSTSDSHPWRPRRHTARRQCTRGGAADASCGGADPPHLELREPCGDPLCLFATAVQNLQKSLLGLVFDNMTKDAELEASIRNISGVPDGVADTQWPAFADRLRGLAHKHATHMGDLHWALVNITWFAERMPDDVYELLGSSPLQRRREVDRLKARFQSLLTPFTDFQELLAALAEELSSAREAAGSRKRALEGVCKRLEAQEDNFVKGFRHHVVEFWDASAISCDKARTLHEISDACESSAECVGFTTLPDFCMWRSWRTYSGAEKRDMYSKLTDVFEGKSLSLLSARYYAARWSDAEAVLAHVDGLLKASMNRLSLRLVHLKGMEWAYGILGVAVASGDAAAVRDEVGEVLHRLSGLKSFLEDETARM